MLAVPVFASDIDENSADNEYVSMETSIGIQSVFTKEIPIIVRFTPNTDSRKASIQWDLPYNVESDSDLKQWFPVEEGQEYEVRIWISPEDPGDYEIPVNVDVFLYNSSHINTKTITFTVNDNLILTPTPPEYIRNSVLKWIAIVLLLIVAGFVLWKIWKLLFPKFKKWLEG
jgi:hypothetical protein